MNRFLTAVTLLSVGLASGTGAQCTPGGPPNPPAVPRAIVGLVMDSSHTPIEGAEVIIKDPRRLVRTRFDGRFLIDSLATGIYELTVRRIGHDIAVQSYAVTDSGATARFCLIPDPHGLAPLITSVKRGGLGGIIGDSAYNPLAGAEVRVVAGGERAVTDTAGGFYLPLKPGSYAIVVKKEGFGNQLLGVTVPKDSGRQIAVWLASPPRKARRVAAAIEDSMRFRLLMARSNRAKLLSSEDIMRNPSFNVEATIQAAAMQAVGLDCEAVIDGGPYALPFWAIDKSEIAAMEVYAVAPARNRPTSIDPRGSRPGAPSSSRNCNVRVYVWLK